MFLKITKNKSGSYARIVESYRDKHGKPKHKTISNIGNIKNFGKDKIIELADSLLKFAQVNRKETLNSLEELGRYNYGYSIIFDKILSEIGLKKILLAIDKNGQTTIYKTFLLMLMERFRNPSSKRENYINQTKHIHYKDNIIPLHKLYRVLDKLVDYSENIKQKLFQARQNVNAKCNVVFYDVTTFYFDSEKEYKDKYRQKGYSKDGKIGKTQVVFGLLIDKNQLPIDYLLYRGDQYEGTTLIDALNLLKKKYDIEQTVIVTDSGMMNLNNIEKIRSLRDYSYIIGERYKSLPKGLKNIYLDKQNYKSTTELLDKSSGEKIVISYFEYFHKTKRLIFTYSEKRAKKDKIEREKKLEKALKYISNPSLLSKKERNYYIKQTSGKKYELDEQKIKLSQQYDGLSCISTNYMEGKVEEILSNYKELYKIEQSFRSMKSYLETRPMYHWTDKRISGHICLCFISYYVLRYLQIILERKLLHKTERTIRSEMNEMEISHIVSGIKNSYYLSSKSTSEMLDCLKIKKLPKIIPDLLINNYINI